jgi:hypothetical protein
MLMDCGEIKQPDCDRLSSTGMVERKHGLNSLVGLIVMLVSRLVGG